MASIIPAIIPADIDELSEKINSVSGIVDIVQIDVVDGKYAKPASWPYVGKANYFKKLASEEEGLPEWSSMDFEVDMMVLNPQKKIEDWIHAGASRIIIHLESAEPEEIGSIIDDYAGAFVELGLAIKPSTPNSKLEFFMDNIDFVQCMGSDNLGHSGEELDERIYDKIREIRDLHPEMPISIDIGVNFETAPKLLEAGASRLVAGSAIFDSADVEEAIREFHEL